jgi:hypothetical protein
MKNKLIVGAVSLCAALGGFVAGSMAAGAKKEIAITQLKDTQWSPMDPSAGDKGPQMSVVFGDLKKKAPIGLLLKFPPGFKPGPHTHTSDDYAVILQGNVHNFAAPGTDEGPAVTQGGHWFQPGGQPHDNECEASSKDGCLVYVVLPNGFDFKPWAAPAAKK